MKKHNFILIPSFSTNSLILKGLISRLSDYFKVFPLDYPGYIKNKPPLKNYSIQTVTKQLEKDIEKLDLRSYIIGGVSMGYLYANNINHKNNCCKGMVAMFPLVSNKTINIKPMKKILFQTGLRLTNSFEIYDLVWNSKALQRLFFKRSFPEKIQNIMYDEINPKSFFCMANLILNSFYEIKSHIAPHVLVINKNDYSIKSSLTTDIFKRKIPNKIVIKSNMPHNPNSLDKKVFDKYLDDTKMKRIVKFFDNYM